MASEKRIIHLYLFTDTPSGKPYRGFDSFDWRSVEGCMKGRVYLGSQEIEVHWPEINETEAAIDAIKEQIEKERADSQVRVNLLLDRISKLQAIGHEVAE